MTNSPEDPAWHVAMEAAGHVKAAAIRAAALLGVADHLAGGPREVAELAELTESNEVYLRRLLRFLASRGIFREDEDGRFDLTPYAEVLRSDVPNSIRAGVLIATSETWWQSAGDLVEAIRHGEPAFDRRYGKPLFDYLAENPSVGRMFNEGMATFAAGDIDLVTAAYDFPDSGVLVDVGGGLGGLLLAVLRARPNLRGVLFDHEKVLAGTMLGQLGADERWELVPGDFFESVPAGDFYLIKNVLHDWNDDQCVRILENCRRAMRPGGKLLVIDAVLPPGNEPHFGKAMDMIMLLLLPGQERSLAEFEHVFSRAGFRVNQVITTAGPLALIEAEVSA
jgi:hypothetical protein